MKVTVHAEGNAIEIAKQLGQHADVYLKAGATETTPVKQPGKKAAKAVEPEFDADDTSETKPKKTKPKRRKTQMTRTPKKCPSMKRSSKRFRSTQRNTDKIKRSRS
jgi:hypothetical protein